MVNRFDNKTPQAGDAMNNEMASPMDPGADTDAAAPPMISQGRLPRLPRATIAMGLMFAAGVAIVVLLSTGSGPQEATASDEAVEQEVETFLAHTQTRDKASDDSGLALIDTLYSYASRRQMPMEKLRSNPFSRSEGTSVASGPTPTPVEPTPVVRVANTRKRSALQSEFNRFKLQGIMVTSHGATAIINSSFATVGQQVGSFIVTRISPDQVELTCEEMIFTLNLTR